MKVLLDTHCWLWAEQEPERLSSAARVVLDDASATLLLSASSAWEIGLKYAAGKLPLPSPPRDYILERTRRNAIVLLAITPEHALHSCELPRHHRDPFDRLLIAQAQLEGIPIVTADPQFRRYDVEVIEA